MTVLIPIPPEPEPDPEDPRPIDPPCPTCEHPASRHEGYVCHECYDRGGPCA